MIRATLLVLATLAAASPALAKPLTYTLPDSNAVLKPGKGPGYDLAQGTCVACHSAEYPNSQPPHKGEAFWSTEVGKMVKLYHAKIDDADAKAIAQYLGETY